MKQYFVLPFACMALWGCGGQDQIETPPLKIIDQIDFSHVHTSGRHVSPSTHRLHSLSVSTK